MTNKVSGDRRSVRKVKTESAGDKLEPFCRAGFRPLTVYRETWRKLKRHLSLTELLLPDNDDNGNVGVRLM